MLRANIVLALLTLSMQYYCYGVFGLSAKSLTANLLPKATESISTYNNFFIIFAIAAFSKPIGSTILSTIGDKYGKIKALRLSAILAFAANCTIAFAPSYASAGIVSIFALLIGRMLLMSIVGGELDGVRLYLTELLPNKSYIVGGLVALSTQIGMLFASVVAIIANDSNYYFYNWRYNFVIGAIFTLIILLIRSYSKETEKFLAYKYTKQHAVFKNISLFTIFEKQRDNILRLIIINGCIGCGYHLHLIFSSLYLRDILKLDSLTEYFSYNFIAIFIHMGGALIAGIMSEKIKAKRLFIILAFVSNILINCLTCLSFFYDSKLIFVTNMLASFLMPFISVPIFIYIQEKLIYGSRYRVISISHALGSTLFSATSPLICGLLYQHTEISAMPYLYFILLLILAFVAFVSFVAKDDIIVT